MNELYTSSQVNELTGVPVQTINYWARMGIFIPAQRGDKKRGSRHMWSEEDVATIAIIRSLRDAGISLRSSIDAAKGVSSALLKFGGF